MMRTAAGGVLPPREAYRRWAPTYAAETAVSLLEERLARRLSPPPAGLRLLDAGCGTGRRMATAGAAAAVGIDLTPEMLAYGRAALRAPVAAADVRALPFRDASFDLVWCRLVLGHVSGIEPAYAELGRVCSPGGRVLVTDFHPAAVRAGHRRTFRDTDGVSREIEHHVHSMAEHARAAMAAGLVLHVSAEERVGPEIRELYARAGRLEAFSRHLGLPLVLGLLLTRRGWR